MKTAAGLRTLRLSEFAVVMLRWPAAELYVLANRGAPVRRVRRGGGPLRGHPVAARTTTTSTVARRMEQIFLHSPLSSGAFRTHAEIEGMFPGLDLVEPGLTRSADWRPDGPRIKPLDAVRHCILGAVGRKP